MNSTTKFAIGSLLTVVGIVLTYLIADGYFKHPEIIFVVHPENQKHCPPNIFMGYYEKTSFLLMFQNVGARNTGIMVSVDSNALEFEENKISWQALNDKDKQINYNFQILINRTVVDNLKEFTINYQYFYDDRSKLNREIRKASPIYSCNYQKYDNQVFILKNK